MVAREICGSSPEDLKLKTASSELIAKHVTDLISSCQGHYNADCWIIIP